MTVNERALPTIMLLSLSTVVVVAAWLMVLSAVQTMTMVQLMSVLVVLG